MTRWQQIPLPARERKLHVAAVVAGLVLAFGLGAAAVKFWPSVQRPVWLAENARSASAHIAAVREDGPGVILNLTVRVIPNGEGGILAYIHPLVGFDFQYSHWIAVEVAAAHVGMALDDDGVGLEGADVVFKVISPGGEEIKVHAIDGPSAGAAATVATIAALENRRVRDDVVITGTIGRDGKIGSVGGIFEKAKAAHGAGATLFLVPPGQSKIRSYQWVEIAPGFYTLRPVTVDLKEYARQQGWRMQIREVSTIEEAIELMLV